MGGGGTDLFPCRKITESGRERNSHSPGFSSWVPALLSMLARLISHHFQLSDSPSQSPGRPHS